MELSLLQDLQDACDQALRKRREGDFSQIGVVVSLVGGRSFEVSIVPIKGDAELGVIMVFHDITEIKRVEQIRRDFVANVSHELRTPLTSIKGYAETLVGIEKYDPEQTRSFLEVILRNANHMNTMLDELCSSPDWNTASSGWTWSRLIRPRPCIRPGRAATP
jgi:Signal transduction histidine kinase